MTGSHTSTSRETQDATIPAYASDVREKVASHSANESSARATRRNVSSRVSLVPSAVGIASIILATASAQGRLSPGIERSPAGVAAATAAASRAEVETVGELTI